MQRDASGGERSRFGAQHILGEMLALVHRQLALGNEFFVRCRPRTLGRVHATRPIIRFGYRAFEHPVRQRRTGQGFACINVFLNHASHLQPARLLPQLERALFGPKAPAHRKINVAGGFGNGL